MVISGCDFDVQVSAVDFAQVEVFGGSVLEEVIRTLA